MADSRKPTGTLGRVAQLLPTAVQKRMDAWENAITGLGTLARDKATQLKFRRNTKIEDSVWDAMYHDDDLAALIVDIIPDEALREGFTVTIQPDKDEAGQTNVQQSIQMSDDIMVALDEFETIGKFNEVWRWGRLFGGGGLLMGIDDGQEDQAEPLREDGIRSVNYIEVIDKRDFTPHTYYDDPEEALFGEAKTYLLHRASAATSVAEARRATSIEIHESRVIVFPGARTSKRKKLENGGWDFSELQKLQSTMELFNQGWLSAGHLLTDANQGVFKIKNLIEMIASGNTDLLKTRMELADYSRSAVRALMLDADSEDFERKATTFTGIPEMLDRFMLRLSAATRIPVSILMGRSPAGMNATGESDFKAFYGRIGALQTQILEPRLRRWVRIMLLAQDGPTKGQEPEAWSITFPSLWQMTPSEESDLQKSISEKDGNYVAMGALDPAEVKASRFRPEGFSTETVINEDDQTETTEQTEQRVRDAMAAEAELNAPAPSPEPAPTEGEPPAPEEAVDPSTALNGAQVTAMKEIVSDVSNKLIPRQTGVNMIAASFPLTVAEADTIMGEVGRTFFADAPAEPVAPGPPTPFGAPVPTPPIPPGAPKPGAPPDGTPSQEED